MRSSRRRSGGLSRPENESERMRGSWWGVEETKDSGMVRRGLGGGGECIVEERGGLVGWLVG